MLFGQDRGVELEVVAGTESEWKLPGHRASVFITGESAAGKDTAIGLLAAFDAHLRNKLGDKPCFNILRVGHPTYAGLLSALQSGRAEKCTYKLWW